MASAPPAPSLPLFYQSLEPLSSEQHADFRLRPQDRAPFLRDVHAIPVTVDEFQMAQRALPIVFTLGDDPIPLALMGLNEGVNVFVDGDGKLLSEDIYVPAYIRRYPFMLARLSPQSEDLSLCFDPTADAVGRDGEGQPLFEDGKPSEVTQGILDFTRQFEEAGARTAQFMRDLKELDLLMEGEVSIQQEGVDQPFVYRGFQMVNEEKLRELRGDQLRKINQNGLLPLVYAHLFSLSLMRDVFAKQVRLGKMPLPQLVV